MIVRGKTVYRGRAKRADYILLSPVSRRTMLRSAAFASSVVASMPTVSPSPGPRRPGTATSRRRPPRASRDRSSGACGKSSSDPAARPAGPIRETRGGQRNPPPATRSRAPRPSLRSTRSAATKSSVQAADPADRSRRHKIADTATRRSRRGRRCSESDSVACRTGAPPCVADLESRPTSTSASADAVVCPSPCATV